MSPNRIDSFSDAADFASDHVLVPVKPEYLSSIGLPLLHQSLNEFKRVSPGQNIDVAGIVFNATANDSPEETKAKSEVKKLAKTFGWKVFDSEVPYSRSFPKGAREGQPIFWTSYARSAPLQNSLTSVANSRTGMALMSDLALLLENTVDQRLTPLLPR